MKVWQPGGHLSEQRDAEVRDWSWRRTRRRIGLLARLTLPYKGRTSLALGTLLAYTLVALAPPYLAKLAIDEGIESGDLERLTRSSLSSSRPQSPHCCSPARTPT